MAGILKPVSRHLIIVGLLLFGLPEAAGAQGVVVDPDSPTGKEYAIPLEAARRATSPSTGGPGSAPTAQKAPLFGEGVTAAGEAGPGETAHGDSARGSGERGSSNLDPATETRPGVRVRPLDVATARPGAPDGGASLAVLLGAGLGVLILGGAAGMVLRARRP